jgi:hypothetical protein
VAIDRDDLLFGAVGALGLLGFGALELQWRSAARTRLARSKEEMARLEAKRAEREQCSRDSLAESKASAERLSREQAAARAAASAAATAAYNARVAEAQQRDAERRQRDAEVAAERTAAAARTAAHEWLASHLGDSDLSAEDTVGELLFAARSDLSFVQVEALRALLVEIRARLVVEIAEEEITRQINRCRAQRARAAKARKGARKQDEGADDAD